MAEQTKDRLLEHEYDGIREYDNPCPAWWHMLFIGTVVFGVFYYMFFQIGPQVGTNGWTLTEAYEDTVAENLKLQFEEIGELSVDEATVLKYMNDPKWLAIGAAVYKTHCKSCHAEDGSGIVGPNLTDDYYKNVNQLMDLAEVIQNGAANGSMPAWKNRLIPNEVVLVSAYVANMRGKDLPGPRGQEGKEIPPWPVAPPEPKTESVEEDK
jgi:cytochrome c oxidase cbb3-type subunit 3